MTVTPCSRTVIFDGDCGFCQRAITWGKRLDWLHRMEWRARLEPGLKEAFPQLSGEETQRRMVSIRQDGKTYGGFFAVRDILVHLPMTFVPALVLHVPGMSLLGVPVYAWIATHRHHFGRKPSASGTPLGPDSHRFGGTSEHRCSIDHD